VSRPDAAINRREISVLSVGHGCVDVCQGAVPALLPFLIDGRGYSYAQATSLLLVMTFMSSMLQPLFGYLADKRSLGLLLPGGIVLGAAGVAVVGLTESYVATLAAVGISGLGVGAYHPEGARYANFVSGQRRATGMSLYAVGGNIGFALGPILVTPLVLLFGIGGVAWMALPLIAFAAYLLRQLPRIDAFRPDASVEVPEAGNGSRRDRWLPFTGVATIAGFRSAVYFGLQAFVPIYFIGHLHSSTAVGNTALTMLLVFGAVGTLVGGRVADRHGKKLVMAVSLGVLTPMLLIFLTLGQIPAIISMAVIGFFMVGTFSITVVLGQEFLPNRIGVASGVTLGAAIGFGGLVAYLLGLLADQVSLTTVMLVIAALPLPAFAISLIIPTDRDPDDAHTPDRTGGEKLPRAGGADLKEWPV
jgi:MFS transporter, FSR family, fosmidomycin resistance protein